jgi:acyl-CoA thioester hydrolase
MTSNNDRAPPTRRSDFPYWMPVATRWHDNDIYGHVNNVVYYSYFDTLVNAHAIAQGAFDLHGAPVIGLVVESGCRYHAPLTFPEAIDAGLRVARLGRSSVTYRIGLFSAGSDSAAADGHFTHVMVDRATRRPVDVPAPLRAALDRLKKSHI